MTYAVLKAMGCDSAIGRIELDWAKGTVRRPIPLKRPRSRPGDGSRLKASGCLWRSWFDTATGGGYPSVPCRYVYSIAHSILAML